MSEIITTPSGRKVYLTPLRFVSVHLVSDQNCIESHHLAALLGYDYHDSIRKLILSTWGSFFEEGVDYKLVHDPQVLETYEKGFRAAMGQLKHIKSSRGRLFLTGSGLVKVFRRTSKPCEDLKAAVSDLVFSPMGSGAIEAEGWKEEARVRARATSTGETSSAIKPTPVTEENPKGAQLGLSWSQRTLGPQQEYAILETLVGHLKSSTDPIVRQVAVLSAETGLGRQLPLDD